MGKTNLQLNTQFRHLLHQELTKRTATNKRYSLRALAKSLDMHSATLSHVYNGRRLLSDEKIAEICQRLGVSSDDLCSDQRYHHIDKDMFAAISDWYHFAILDLTFVKNFKSDPQWIADRLGLETPVVEAAVERLLRLGLLKKTNGRLQKASPHVTNATSVNTTAALKEYQRQVVTKALGAIDACPQDKKDITSICFPTDPKKLDEARRMIKNFRRELCDFLGTGEKESVYLLTVQLFPLS